MTAMLLSEDDLTGLVTEIFVGLLGESAELPYPCARIDVHLPIVGFVAVRGGWHAEVVVACSRLAASRFAEQMFVLPAGDVTDNDLRDVVGEIANVLGGNLKSLMPGPSALSLPHPSLNGAVELTYPAQFAGLQVSWSREPIHIRITTPSSTSIA